jgi:threonine synthase
MNSVPLYQSTRTNDSARFSSILMQGLAPDGGLYVPQFWPSASALCENESPSFAALSAGFLSLFIGDEIPRPDLERMTHAVYQTPNFAHPDIVPLKKLDENFYLLELFHGPTFAFKDVALQILGQLFDYFLEKSGQTITILGATSGDTGSAAIEACRGRKNIKVCILHPHNRTSDLQRRQMTSVLDHNIRNIAIQGSFDECQNLVKDCFEDPIFRQQKNLSAINSINWARIIAQSVYYLSSFLALKRPCSFAVPTGNFGNVYAAHVARRCGVPMGDLIIGSNRNDILTRFFATGSLKTNAVEPSLSPSMDIQISSNFERYMFELLGQNTKNLHEFMQNFKSTGQAHVSPDQLHQARKQFKSDRLSDPETLEIMRTLYDQYGEIIDPHTAVGIGAYWKQKDHIETDNPVVCLACAHAGKFPDAVKKALGDRVSEADFIPEALQTLKDKPERFDILEANSKTLKDALRDF